MTSIEKGRATGRRAKDQLTGMILEEAFALDGLWVGQLRSPPGSLGGWHHHGAHETYTYLVEGCGRIEWGEAPSDGVDLEPGEFVHVPALTVHRERNTGTEPNLFVIFRTGTGPVTVPVPPRGAAANG